MKARKKNNPTTPGSPAPTASGGYTRLMVLAAGIAILALIAVVFFYRGGSGNAKEPKEFTYRDPKLNPNTSPGTAPDGMVWIPGGEFYMGTDVARESRAPMFRDAFVIHLVYVDGFWMDKYEVTNEQFAKFVAATDYVTDAEKKPDPKDFPGVPLADLKPFSIVFKKPKQIDNLDDVRQWMKIVYGASWKHPEGPDSTTKGRENHPVVHISHNDAVAYCKWAKKRLPTEAEWEFAARGGRHRTIFPWGDELKPDGKWQANVWQGQFPIENTKEDGFEGTAPVGSFQPNRYGLYDMAGNAWEWCADWYQETYYEESAHPDPDQAVRNPQGPISGADVMEPGARKRVQRGGSFLCDESYCMAYVLGARGKGEVTSSANHIGFRCVMDAK
jgi:formylglycine-generating enzyme required for sulfatase activity